MDDKTTDRFIFPFEGVSHIHTILAYPSAVSLPSSLLEPVRMEIANLAWAISTFEPVKLYIRPEDVEDARSRLDGTKTDISRIAFVPFVVNHCWVRDAGPVYVFSNSEEDAVRYSINFNFNEWGGKVVGISGADVIEWGQIWPPLDAATIADNTAFARRVIDSEWPEVRRIDSPIILEGGGIICDGEGTLLITESCIVDEVRNPGWSKAAIELELKRLLGIEKIIWFPGAKNEDITDCHMDAIVRFVRPGVVVESRPHESQGQVWTQVYEETRRILEKETDARGRRFDIITLHEPDIGPLLKNDTDEICTSRVNWYMVNGGVIAPRFGDAKQDQESLEIMQRLWPDREVRQVDVNATGIAGGGLHCVTQQVPRRRYMTSLE